ncbi:MAG: GNAT family N-acetyltransferase, partial [Geodermatophilaceae bacterium]|nr:GNAT family N-acetyltransferase [Geodermatophilaceae bacterium]
MSELARAVVCRPERPGEVAALRDVVARSFGEPVVADLVEALRVSTAWVPGLSFVAEYDGGVIGQALFT